MSSFTIAIAGTTERTVLCAEQMRLDSRFSMLWTLTPQPRPIGRKQVLTKNPVHLWSESHGIETISIESKIDDSVRHQISAHVRPDFLLVVDFGYWIPGWLLALPSQKPLNVHPSDLPRWRGSSPGQFALLYGEKNSAVCLIEMSQGMDEGPIVQSLPFAVDHNWTQTEYYSNSFALIAPKLPDLLAALAAHEISASAQPQSSPTPVASRLSKADSFVEWSALTAAMSGNDAPLSSLVLAEARSAHASLAALLEHATRAFAPWPLLWTELPTKQGKKRLQILSARITTAGRLQLDGVKLEGKNVSSWDEIKNNLL